MGDVFHGVDALAPQQKQGRCVVHLDVVKRVGDNLECPRNRGFGIADQHQLRHPE